MGISKKLGLSVVTGLLLAAVPSLGFADWRPDAWITTKAKIALATSENVNATDVNVDTVNGLVTLHGKVPTEAAKNEAANVVDDIDGVVKVTNLLQVVPPSQENRVEKEDSEIKTNVSKALEDQKDLTGSDIQVSSVNKGVVLLSGNADSLFDHLAAVRIAAAVPGVQRVASEVKTDDRLYDEDELAAYDGESTTDKVKSGAKSAADTTKDAAKSAAETTKEGAQQAWNKTKDAAEATGDAAKGAAETTSSSLRDAYITATTKTRLIADADTPALDINVDTRDGNVTLFGVVATEEIKREAEAEARQVSGVKTVRNELVVKKDVATDAGADRVAKNDDAVKQGVESALNSRTQLRDADIDVAVAGGVVRLTGEVPDEALRQSAGTIARAVDGVRAVKNELRIEQAALH
jgi:hyperosmotically inducible protein